LSCENKVCYYIPHGYDYKEVFTKCGNTNPFGYRAVCDKCADDSGEMRRIEEIEANAAADNAWLKSAGWGEM